MTLLIDAWMKNVGEREQESVTANTQCLTHDKMGQFLPGSTYFIYTRRCCEAIVTRQKVMAFRLERALLCPLALLEGVSVRHMLCLIAC